MKRYRLSPPFLMFTAAFILIDGTLFSVVAVACALWHELWHIIVLRILGKRVSSFSVNSFGMGIKTPFLGYREESAVALAGPISSLAGFAVMSLMSLRYSGNALAVFAAASNLALFLVNILPIYPLDGGRALYNLVCLISNPRLSAKITRLISAIFLLPLSAFSVIILVRTGYNLSLIVICTYLIILLVTTRL